MEQALAYFTSAEFVSTLVVIAVAAILMIALRRIQSKHAKLNPILPGEDKRRKKTQNFIYVLLRYIILLLAIIAVLSVNGVDVTALAASIGIVSVVVGFALQDALNDIIMGFHIMIDKFFETGDIIKYKNITGEVILITPQTTKIRSIDDQSVTSISNRLIDEAQVVSHTNTLDIRLSYEDPSERIKEVLESACERISEIDGVDKCVYKGVQNLGDSGVDYRMMVYCHPLERNDIMRESRGLLLDTVKASGLDIPYDQIKVLS